MGCALSVPNFFACMWVGSNEGKNMKSPKIETQRPVTLAVAVSRIPFDSASQCWKCWVDSQTTSAPWGFQKLAFELNFDEQNRVVLVAPPSRLPGDGVSSRRPLVPRISTVVIGSVLPPFWGNFIFLWLL